MMNQFIDTHCHIQSSDAITVQPGEESTHKLWAKAGFPGGDALIAHAATVGVATMVAVGCDLADSQLAVSFANEHPECWASIGIHPHEASKYVENGVVNDHKWQQFAALANEPRAIAVGECGLDYFYTHSEPADQVLMLTKQLELAQMYDMPLIFHVREALDEFWPIFDSFSTPDRPLRGVLHSFTDTAANLDKAMARGLYIGVNGIATFAKSDTQLEMYKAIPLSRLLLETDSPFLTPSPYRGNICEPYHISVTAEFLAELRNEPLDQLALATTANARDLFKL